MKEAVYVHQDRVEISVTADAAWHQVDLTSYLDNPSDCVGVGLIGFKDYTGPETHYWGIDQDSWTIPAWMIALHSRGIEHAVVGLDANNKVWLYRYNSNVKIYLAVEFLSPGAVFYDEPLDRTPDVANKCNVWRTIVCGDGSYEGGDDGENVEAVLVQAKTRLATTGYWNTRSFGSSVTQTFRTDIDWAAHWYAQNAVPVDYGGSYFALYDQYSSATVVDKAFDPHQLIYEMGYLREPERSGYHAHFDPVEQTVATAGAWTTVQCGSDVPVYASAILARIENPQATGYQECGVRAVGSSDPYSDLERGYNHLVSIAAQLDSSRQYQYYAESTNVNIWRLGYSSPVVNVDSSVAVVLTASGETAALVTASVLLKIVASGVALEPAELVAEGITVEAVLGGVIQADDVLIGSPGLDSVLTGDVDADEVLTLTQVQADEALAANPG